MLCVDGGFSLHEMRGCNTHANWHSPGDFRSRPRIDPGERDRRPCAVVAGGGSQQPRACGHHQRTDRVRGRKELSTITAEARAAHTAIRTLFVQHVLETREADKREFVFLSQLQSQPNISWVAFGWPDGTFFAAHKLGDLGLEMMEIAPVDGVDQAARRPISGGGRRHRVRETPLRKYRLRRHRSGMVPERHAASTSRAGSSVGSSGGIASVDRLCRPDRRVPETPGRARHHDRIHAVRAIPVTAFGRKIRRGIHSGPAMGRRSPHRIRMPTKSTCSGRISRCCRSPKAP